MKAAFPTPQFKDVKFPVFPRTGGQMILTTPPCWRSHLNSRTLFWMRQRRWVYRDVNLGREDAWGWVGVDRVRGRSPTSWVHVRCESWGTGWSLHLGCSRESPYHPGTLHVLAHVTWTQSRERIEHFSAVHVCTCTWCVSSRLGKRGGGPLFLPPNRHLSFFSLKDGKTKRVRHESN